MSRTSLTSLLDSEVVELERVVEALRDGAEGRDPDALAELVDLGARLPSGAIHAEAIWVLAEPPPGVGPLAPGSTWYATGRALAVVVPPGKWRLVNLLRDLGRYAAAADGVHRALGGCPHLVDGLGRIEASPSFFAELAVALDAPPSLVASLDHRASGLRADLAAMAGRTFRPRVRVHASLRPGYLRRKGQTIAQDLLSRLPEGTFRVLLSDGHLALEHLSPYVRDLGHALSTWALENPGCLSLGGLEEALRRSRDRPSPDLGALVVPDLLRAAPGLLEERRGAEEGAGLHLHDEADVIYGRAELSGLPLPDEWAIGKGVSGPLAVIASGGDELLSEALRVLLDSGRVAGLACVLAAGIPRAVAIIPGALVDDRDGVRLAFSADVVERAVKRGVDLERPPLLSVSNENGAPELAMFVLGQVRRSRALGRLLEDAPAVVTLYPRDGQGLQGVARGLGELEAGRLALAALLQAPDSHGGKQRGGGPQIAPAVSRRFRA